MYIVFKLSIYRNGFLTYFRGKETLYSFVQKIRAQTQLQEGLTGKAMEWDSGLVFQQGRRRRHPVTQNPHLLSLIAVDCQNKSSNQLSPLNTIFSYIYFLRIDKPFLRIFPSDFSKLLCWTR